MKTTEVASKHLFGPQPRLNSCAASCFFCIEDTGTEVRCCPSALTSWSVNFINFSLSSGRSTLISCSPHDSLLHLWQWLPSNTRRTRWLSAQSAKYFHLPGLSAVLLFARWAPMVRPGSLYTLWRTSMHCNILIIAVMPSWPRKKKNKNKNQHLEQKNKRSGGGWCSDGCLFQ